ncbi:hypothetical protein [Arenimonas oryziterrae]|uniref:Uncharacterized protein n=1 Tax=Arenimonas oryziterrae DSM 21050 = YC6267 TaxID=1121015 RepID=A0A091AXD2_9GAMM|nr:hypothetical protein [Arenimonas oryziterrae]KFN44938.1 hypothetical protein N789_02645 [Arenimonas oryziterrae DSM 21050 = YC6267]
MSRSLIALFLLSLTLLVSACSGEQSDETKKEAKAPVVLTAPSGTDDNAWKTYLGQVAGQNQEGVTDRTIGYYLPANSTTPDPADPDNKSQYDRQFDLVQTAIARTVTPGNMLAFGSPDSTKMADLIVAAFTGAEPDAVKGSKVLFIGKPIDSGRVQTVVEAAGGKYVFVEAK